MQSKNDKSLITQHSFDHSNSIHNQMYEDRPKLVDANPRKSMINLSSTINLKEKPRIPIIRDRSVPNPTAIRRTTIVEQNNIDIKKTKMKSCEEKYRKTIKKRRKIIYFNLESIINFFFITDSSETPADDVDSDGSELSSVSKISSTSALSTQSERPRNLRKHRYL
jgi:hypothetical protein